GHSGDHFNDKVDELARLMHGHDSLPIAFIPDNLFSISYIPCWNNVIVEKHLRHFITDLSRNCGFEQFINLYRNNKYLEHVKKRHPDLYKHWNYPMCRDEIETFKHVWKCKSHKNIIDSIIFNNKKCLVKL
ncbi:5796_t:CDS:2, partial [Entrophospora sp. SA101]